MTRARRAGVVVLVAVALRLSLIVGLGALADALSGRDASDTMGVLSLLAIGVGFSLAAPAHRDRLTGGLVLALAAFGLVLGTKLLFESHGLAGTSAIAGPYLAAACVALVVRPLRADPAAPGARPQPADTR